MSNNEDHFNILRKLNSKPNSTQRELAKDLDISLGKLNYCLNELKKGLVKIKNFRNNKNKMISLHFNPSGVKQKLN